MSTSTSPVKPAAFSASLPTTSSLSRPTVSNAERIYHATDLPVDVLIESQPDANKSRRVLSAFLKGVGTFEIWQSLIAAFLLLAGALHSCPADAAGVSPNYRLTRAYRSFSDVYQVTAAWPFRAPQWIPRWIGRARTEFAAGVISGHGDTRPFASVGPVWRLTGDEQPVFVEFGFSPTLLGGSTLGNQDLGGNLHFTSSLAVGREFGRRQQFLASMRIQHLSNGGLNRTNPGLDSIGVGFSGSFGKR